MKNLNPIRPSAQGHTHLSQLKHDASFLSIQKRGVSEKWQLRYNFMSHYSLNARYYDRYHTRTLKYSFDMGGDLKSGVMSGAFRRPVFLDAMIRHPPILHVNTRCSILSLFFFKKQCFLFDSIQLTDRKKNTFLCLNMRKIF